MATENEIEMPTTPAWRVLMLERRWALGISQTELAHRARVSQPVISNIETGEMAASAAVTRIAHILHIPPPFAVLEDDLDDRLLKAGRAIRSTNPDLFLAQLQLLETLVKSLNP